LIKRGGLPYAIANYKDILIDERANREAYDFWRDYVRTRIRNPKNVELLAPTEPVHPWGVKRSSLEQGYFEIYDLPHVDLIDVNSDPIEEFTELGIRTKSGLREFDLVALATGFDSLTGSLAQLDIRGMNGETIAEHWKDGLRTAMGISLANFPNFFFLYGPQAPTAFANGPTFVQLQAKWIETALDGLIKKGITRFVAKPEKEVDWTKLTHELWYSTLRPKGKSWYQGSNIPGKKEEPLTFSGGVPFYTKTIYESLENNYQDWIVA